MRGQPYLLLGNSFFRSLLRSTGSNDFTVFSGMDEVDNELSGSRSSTAAAEEEALRRWKGRWVERDGANTRGSTLAQRNDDSWSAILMCAGERNRGRLKRAFQCWNKKIEIFRTPARDRVLGVFSFWTSVRWNRGGS